MALGGLGAFVAWMVYAGTEDAHTMTRALLPLPLVLALVILGDHFDARRPS
jgi:predicted Kef-type K+ transport protein